MSSFIILQRRLKTVGRAFMRIRNCLESFGHSETPQHVPGVPFTRTGPEMGGHITSTPPLQWVNRKTASAATKGTPVRLQVGLLYKPTLGEQPYDMVTEWTRKAGLR